MATPPRLRAFRIEDYQGAPAWFLTFLQALNEPLTAIANALNRGLTRSENLRSAKREVAFTTKASVDDTFPLTIKNELGTPPTMLWVGKIARDDGRAITTAVTASWKVNTAGDVELTHVSGLDAQTAYRLTVAYE